MNIRTSLIALALASATVCFAPVALANSGDQDQSTSQDAQQAPQQANEDHEEHQQVRNDVHEAGQNVKEGAHEVGEKVREGAHEVGESIHHTAHWRRYHVCRRYWHHHCTRWSRRYPH
jgi:RNA processing factor Prp31